MTRIAYDSNDKEFTVHVFNCNSVNDIADKDELYSAFESGWPVVIKGITIEGVDYDYYDNLDDWIIEGNKWIMPWYNSHIKKRERLRNERGWSEEEIDVFHKKQNNLLLVGKFYLRHFSHATQLLLKCFHTGIICLLKTNYT